MTFLDTNVLVYAVDGRDAEKQQAAKKIVMAARNSPEYMISAQVLNEFTNVALNKLKKTREETRDFVGLFMSIAAVAVRPEWTASAIDINSTVFNSTIRFCSQRQKKMDVTHS